MPPLTPTVTVNPWAVVMLEDDGVTVTVGIVADAEVRIEIELSPWFAI